MGREWITFLPAQGPTYTATRAWITFFLTIALFDELKNRSYLSSAFPSETSATVIFYNILTSYLFYLYNFEKTMKELTESIREQVQFILEGRETEG
jgi:hypothetical protein